MFRPPNPRGFASVFLACLAFTLSIGCSSAWASTAATANDLAGVARSEVLHAREDAITRAGQAVLEAGGDSDAIRDAVNARAADFDDAIATVNLAIAVKDRYVALALDAVRGELPDSARAAAGRALRDFGAVYRSRVVPLLESLGRPAPPFPEELEDWIADLLEGEPDATDEATAPEDPGEATDDDAAGFVHLHTAAVS